MYSSWLRDVHNNVATPALGDALQLAPHLVPSLSAITLTMSVKQTVGNDEGRRGGKQARRRAMRWRGDALFLERLTAITPTLLRTSEDVPHGVRVTLRDNDMFAFLEALLQNWAPLELGPIESRYYDNQGQVTLHVVDLQTWNFLPQLESLDYALFEHLSPLQITFQMKGAQIDEENGKWVNTPAPEHAFALIRALGLPTAA